MKPKQKTQVPILYLLLFVLGLNVAIVDGWLLWHFSHGQNRVLGTTDTCPQSCKNLITQSKTTTSATKEYFIPLGSGSGSSTDWTDVSGVQSYIDSTSYPKNITVTFETTVSVPNASQVIWARLYNVTDKHPVWLSEVTTNESGPTVLTSSPVNLDSGNKLYRMQLRTQLGGATTIGQARVHIVAK